MLNRLLGQGTAASMLKEGLDVSSKRAREIASRIANAANNPNGGFAGVLERTQGGEAEQVDLETEMVALADEQLRFEAATRLLQKVYAQVRASVRERS
jgi:flagellar basal body rod protein FlgB